MNFCYSTADNGNVQKKQNANSDKILKTYSDDESADENQFHFAIVIRVLKVRSKYPNYSPRRFVFPFTWKQNASELIAVEEPVKSLTGIWTV